MERNEEQSFAAQCLERRGCKGDSREGRRDSIEMRPWASAFVWMLLALCRGQSDLVQLGSRKSRWSLEVPGWQPLITFGASWALIGSERLCHLPVQSMQMSIRPGRKIESRRKQRPGERVVPVGVSGSLKDQTEPRLPTL